MNLFSLLSHQEVHLSKGQKRIPKEEFSSLISAKELVETAKQEIQELKQKLQKEGEQQKKQGYEDGYQEGLTKLNEKMLYLDQTIRQLQLEMQQKILPLALQAAKKIVNRELTTDPSTIIDIVLQSLKPVLQSSQVKIIVNKQDREILESHKSKIREVLEHVQSLMIEDRSDVEPGGCFIETESGIINASLENQWRALEAAFERFTKKQT